MTGVVKPDHREAWNYLKNQHYVGTLTPEEKALDALFAEPDHECPSMSQEVADAFREWWIDTTPPTRSAGKVLYYAAAQVPPLSKPCEHKIRRLGDNSHPSAIYVAVACEECSAIGTLDVNTLTIDWGSD